MNREGNEHRTSCARVDTEAGFAPPTLIVDTRIKSTLMYFYLLNFSPMGIYFY